MRLKSSYAGGVLTAALAATLVLSGCCCKNGSGAVTPAEFAALRDTVRTLADSLHVYFNGRPGDTNGQKLNAIGLTKWQVMVKRLVCEMRQQYETNSNNPKVPQFPADSLCGPGTGTGVGDPPDPPKYP